MSYLSRRQFIGVATGLVVAGSGLAVPARAMTIKPRSSWTSEPPTGPLSSEDVRFLIVHHSASHNGHSSEDVPAILRSWYAFHTGPEKGWPDIAYNFIIDSEGGVWEGRQGSLDGPVAGSATGGNQGYTQLVCLIGDYNSASPTQDSLDSLVALLAWLADRYEVSTAPGAEVTFTSRGSNKWPEGTEVTTPTITGHRTMSQTTCPGDNLYPYVSGSLTADVEALRGGSPLPTAPSTTTTSPTTTTTAAPTTTTVPTATTVPPKTTTTAAAPPTSAPQAATATSSTVTTIRVETTSTSSTTTLPAPTTSAPLALAAGPAWSGAPLAALGAAGALVVTGAGLLLWRSRRMGR